MRILSWNINGLNRILKNYFNNDINYLLRVLDSDIICFQGLVILHYYF